METADLSRRWCPGCEPEADPLTEILSTLWCSFHEPNSQGADDPKVPQGPRVSSFPDGDGETGRAYAALLSRPSPHAFDDGSC